MSQHAHVRGEHTDTNGAFFRMWAYGEGSVLLFLYISCYIGPVTACLKVIAAHDGDGFVPAVLWGTPCACAVVPAQLGGARTTCNRPCRRCTVAALVCRHLTRYLMCILCPVCACLCVLLITVLGSLFGGFQGLWLSFSVFRGLY